MKEDVHKVTPVYSRQYIWSPNSQDGDSDNENDNLNNNITRDQVEFDNNNDINFEEDLKSDNIWEWKSCLKTLNPFIVPPNTPAELNLPSLNSSHITGEQLFPTPVERSPNYLPANSINSEDYLESSVENTGISIHTVPSTAIRSIWDMDALMFISSSHTPVSISSSFNAS